MTKLRSQAGFTITELMISVVIIAVGIIGFATAVGLVSTELWYGQRDTKISMIVIDQAELLKSMPYDSVTSGSRDGEYELAWTVQGTDPKKVILEARYDRHSSGEQADTIVFFIPR